MNEVFNDIFCSHDKLFKEIWSDLENARSFLENYLPPAYLTVFDLKTLEICKGSFVEKNLKEYHSDLLYKVKTHQGHAFIYFLFEHKSYPDGLIHLQLLKYMIGIWELSIKQNRKKRFDAIVPLVMFHGKKQWTTPKRFAELFSGTSGPLVCHIPDFKYILFDLPKYSDEQIRGTIIERLMILVFKHIFDSDFDQNFRVFSNC
ncbi:hypothetical protein JCM14469_04810 [Desulfatiferula olefinivorans]